MVANNINLLAALLNRQMPQELHEVLVFKGIELFPEDWQDMNMRCSCPDWAVPCKHLAAVTYLIANEIDQNPFILFNLRGLDLLSELENRGFIQTESSDLAIPKFSNFLFSKEDIESTKDQPFNMKDYMQLPFQVETEGVEALLALLDDQSLFYQFGNFKSLLSKAYRKSIRQYKKQLKILSTKEVVSDFILDSHELYLFLDENGFFPTYG